MYVTQAKYLKVRAFVLCFFIEPLKIDGSGVVPEARDWSPKKPAKTCFTFS